MDTLISAVVCTHNRSAYLKKAIKSLAEQTLPKEQYEVIVVDNASNDDTKAVVRSFGQASNLRYIYEPILGLSQARNTGWQNAQGKYVAYLDDDAIACPEWLEKIMNAFDTVKPTPGSVGGKVVPIWEAERPTWLSKELEIALGIIDWKDSATFLKEKDPMLFGSNIATPRDILGKLGGFSTSLGIKGSKMLLGEEMLLKDLLRSQNLMEYYDPQICVQHHVLANRLTKKWFYTRYFWGGVSEEILRYIEAPAQTPNCRYLLKVLTTLFALIKRPTILIAILAPSNSGTSTARKCTSYLYLGRLWAQVRIGLGLEATHRCDKGERI